jgi:hypothetical protein
MTAAEIAYKYVHGKHDALTETQEKLDMAEDIRNHAEQCHQAKLKNSYDIDEGLASLGYFPGDTPTTDPIQKIIYGGREYILNN